MRSHGRTEAIVLEMQPTKAPGEGHFCVARFETTEGHIALAMDGDQVDQLIGHLAGYIAQAARVSGEKYPLATHGIALERGTSGDDTLVVELASGGDLFLRASRLQLLKAVGN